MPASPHTDDQIREQVRPRPTLGVRFGPVDADGALHRRIQRPCGACHTKLPSPRVVEDRLQRMMEMHALARYGERFTGSKVKVAAPRT